MAPLDPSFGQVVKERRRVLRLTQTELARRVACATITIRKVEADGMRPSQQIIERLAMSLDVPLEERASFVQLARVTAIAGRAPSPLPTPTPAPEEIGLADLSGRAIRGYELGERLGSGGFGVVYRAVQPLLEREVAVKIVLPQYADHPDFIRRFEAEAQLVARLEHPYIVPLYDYWREPGVAYLVMRLLRGGSLEDRVRAGPLALEMVAVLLEQIGAALHAAHRQGVVHRDLKPANVLLDEDGNSYLADFGIAKNLNVAEQTQVGTIVASPAYASPEQIRSETVLPQADIYGLGVLLYELLAGEKPFPGPTPIDYIQQHLGSPLPSLAIQPGLDPLLRRATAKDPAARYPDVPSLLADFRQALAGRPLPAVPYALAGPGAELENPYKGLRAFTEADAADFYGRETLVQELLGNMAVADEEEEGARVPRELGRFLAVVGPSGCGKSSVVKAGLIPALRRGALPGSEQWFGVDMQPGAHPFEELEAALLRVAVQNPAGRRGSAQENAVQAAGLPQAAAPRFPVNPPESLLAQLREGERGLLRAVRRVLPADPGVELVLVIDQFEELFTQVADEAERAAFIAALVTAVVDPESRVRVVVTLRADFTDRPLQYVDLGELVRQRAVFVLPLTAEELEEAIARPAARVALEEGLVARIVQDVGEEPGVLPLLQYALTELWERCVGRGSPVGAHAVGAQHAAPQPRAPLLTLAAYRESGGVSAALARRAEELYGSLTEGEQEAARQLFLRLVTLGEGMEDTRRRVLQAEVEGLGGDTPLPTPRQPTAGTPLPSPQSGEGRGAGGRGEDFRQVLNLFGRHRLLTFDRDPLTRGPTVEVAHEALLREWGRLRGWLEESRGDVRQQRLLAAAAGEWETAGREPSYLLQGARLAQFVGWAAGSRVALTGGEREYLEASVATRGEREEEEKARREHELQTALQLAETEKARAEEQGRHARRLRQRALWLAGALVVAAVLAALAFLFGQSATRNLNTAQTAQMQAVAEAGVRATAQAVAETQQGVAQDEAHARATAEAISVAERQAALANLNHSEALRLAAESNRLRLKEASPELIALLALRSLRLEYTPQGDEALEGAVQLDYPTRVLTCTTGTTVGVVWSPDGRSIAVSGGPSIFLCDAASGRQLLQLTGHTDSALDVVFSPDGRLLASGSRDGTSRVWDVASGQEVGHFTSTWQIVAFSPDGEYLLVEAGRTVRMMDLASGQVARTFAGPADAVYGVAFSPDGRYVLAASAEKMLWLWDAGSGQVQWRRPTEHTSAVVGVAFFPDGQSFLTVGGEGGVRVRDTASGAERQHVELQTAIQPPNFFVLSPDGRTLLVNTWDGVSHLLDVARGVEVRHFRDPGQVNGCAFSPDGHILATTSGDGGVRLWAAAPQGSLPRFPVQGGYVNKVAFAPDGRTLATAGFDGTARLWDAQSGAELRVFTHTAEVWGLAFAPDGRTIATGAFDGMAHLWDIHTGQDIRRFTGHTNIVADVTFSPDGQSLVSVSLDNTARLWDVATGQQRRVITVPSVGGFLAFSPSGETILTSSAAGGACLWDVATGEMVGEFGAGAGGVAFSPDGRYVLFTDNNEAGILHMGNIATGAEVRRFVGGEMMIQAVFSPDGRYLLAGDQDDTARLWDYASGQELRRFVGHTGDAQSVAFSPDGKVIATGSWDNTFRLWYADINDTIADLCSRLPRDLTPEERERYGIGAGETCPLHVER